MPLVKNGGHIQVLPESTPAIETYKWLTSNRRDLIDLGDAYRNDVYKQRLQACKEAKDCNTRNFELGRHPVPVTSRYCMDFCRPGTGTPQVPEPLKMKMKMIQDAPKYPKRFVVLIRN